MVSLFVSLDLDQVLHINSPYKNQGPQQVGDSDALLNDTLSI